MARDRRHGATAPRMGGPFAAVSGPLQARFAALAPDFAAGFAQFPAGMWRNASISLNSQKNFVVDIGLLHLELSTSFLYKEGMILLSYVICFD
jgi:hypothetical protein